MLELTKAIENNSHNYFLNIQEKVDITCKEMENDKTNVAMCKKNRRKDRTEN